MDWQSDTPQALMEPPRTRVEEPAPIDGVSLFDYWDVVVSRWKLIGGLCLGAIALAATVSLLLPKIYESTAAVLPQLESKETGALGALLMATGAAGNVAQNLGVNLPGLPTTPTDVFVSILKSRVMADDVIAKFNLMERYREKTMVDTREELSDRVRITVTKEKVVKVAVEDIDPQVAADMANFYAWPISTA
ncbi:MAG: Wzz/FepE/Etk N-terminal domain-containing protein [Nitrospiraceae bacterium]